MPEIEELKDLIKTTLVEPPGKLTKDLILGCRGLFKIDPENRKIRLAEPERIAEDIRTHWPVLGKGKFRTTFPLRAEQKGWFRPVKGGLRNLAGFLK